MTVCGLLRLDGADVRRSALTGMLAASSIGLPAARRVHLDGPFGVVTAADRAAGSTPSVLVGPSGLVIVIAEHDVDGRVVPVGRAGRVRAASPATSVRSGIGAGSVTVLRPAGPWRPLPLRRPDGGQRSADAARLGERSDPRDRGVPDDRGAAGAGAATIDDRPGGLDSRGGPDRAADGDRGPGVASALMRAYRAAGQGALGTLGEHLLAIVWEPGRRRMIVSRGGRRADELVVWSDGRYFAFGVEPAQVLAARPLGLARPRRLAAGETLPVTVATRIRRPPFVDLPEPRGSGADVPAT